MTREHLAQVSLNANRNACAIRAPGAITKQELTSTIYMAARMITSPFSLHDCDRFTDGSTVLIVSAGDALDEVRCTPVRIAAMAGCVDRCRGTRTNGWPPTPPARNCGRQTDYQPKDVDHRPALRRLRLLADLLARSPRVSASVGEGHRFIEGGTRISTEGELPLNTGGGQIGAGRLHGFGFAHEAVLQLRGQGGERQIPGDPKVAVATSGGGPLAAALLLARD